MDRTAAKYQLEVVEYSQSVKSDLKALDSELASPDLVYLHQEDTRWPSETGQVLINTIGRFAPTVVAVSIFENDALLRNDQNAAAFRNDLVSAASVRWRIIESSSSDGTYHECSMSSEASVRLRVNTRTAAIFRKAPQPDAPCPPRCNPNAGPNAGTGQPAPPSRVQISLPRLPSASSFWSMLSPIRRKRWSFLGPRVNTSSRPRIR